jgi:hypothetical protein
MRTAIEEIGQFLRDAARRDGFDVLTIEEPKRPDRCVASLSRLLQDRVKHRREIARR